MNAKTNKIYPFIKYSFLKRLLIILLVIIIAFTSSFKPKEVKAVVPVIAGIAAVAGIVLTVTGIAVNATVLSDWFSNKKGMNEEDVVDYFNNNISVDGDGNYIFTDDATMVINDFLTDYNDSVTMVYRYPLNKSNIDASNFPNKIFLDTFISLMQAFPDCYFYVESDYRGNYDAYDRVSGTKSTTVWPNHYIINVVKSPFAGVNAYPDLVTTPVTLYDENWEVCKVAKIALCSSDNYATADNITYFSIDNIYYYNAYRRYDGTLYSSFDDFVNSELSYVFNATDVSMCNQFSWKRTLTDFKTPYSVSNDPINVYKTVADMKKDIGSQVIGSYTPDYTGTPNFNITQTDIDNCVNNYYPSDPDDDPGGGSVSDDSGGSGSGGSGIIDGLGKLFGAIGNIIDKLFGFVLGLLSKVVDFFGSILEMFTETLTKLIDIIPSGFNEFLAAMFPYIPEEWITIAEFILLVSAIGCVVALFKR